MPVNEEVENFDYSVLGSPDGSPLSLDRSILTGRPQVPAHECTRPHLDADPLPDRNGQTVPLKQMPPQSTSATPCEAHSKAAPNVFKRRRNIAKAVGLLVVVIVAMNVMSSWARTSTSSATSPTSIADQGQIGNLEMVTADASLHREYHSIQSATMSGQPMSSYVPTPGFLVSFMGSKVAIVTTVGAHCWILLADGLRSSISTDPQSCAPGAAAVIRAHLISGK